MQSHSSLSHLRAKLLVRHFYSKSSKCLIFGREVLGPAVEPINVNMVDPELNEQIEVSISIQYEYFSMNDRKYK